MRKIIILICILFLAVSCCETCKVSKQVTVTFSDGSTKVYKAKCCSDITHGQVILVNQNNERIILTNCKEIVIKKLSNKSAY